MPDPLSTEIIAALSRLNGHARAHGFGRRAIYAYKTFIATAFATEARPVQVQVKCHHCGGTGQYRDYDGYHCGLCYRCTKGIATLRFIESTLGEHRWHHPTGGNSDGGNVLNAAWGIRNVVYPEAGGSSRHGVAVLHDGTERPIVYQQAEGWGPNMPGAEKLPTEEACQLLNLIEAWLDTAEPLAADRWTYARWPHDKAMTERRRYRLALERLDESACCICGTPDIPGYRCGGSSKWSNGWADYSRPMCEACHGPRDALRWPQEPHPATLTPEVLTWLGRPWRQGKYRSEYPDA